jgi:DNA invertase Pin-like site-specific DNA recombinase
MTKTKRVAIYARVSTDKQTTANQLKALQEWAARCGHTIVKVYEDRAISGTKGREQRPAYDAMLKDAVRRDFDMIAVWSSDRLGRSLQHLIEVLQTIRDTKAGLYIHTQALDTTTPAGRAMFQMLGVFAEFERELIVSRVNAGLSRARAEGKQLGRPKIDDATERKVQAMLKTGTGILKVAKTLGLGTGTVQRIKYAMTSEAAP